MKKQRNNTAAKRALAKDWDNIVDKWEAMPKFSRERNPVKSKSSNTLTFASPTAARNCGASVKSLSTYGHSTAAKGSKQYTGTNMVGVSVLHKSVAVPVFSVEDVQDIARMRR